MNVHRLSLLLFVLLGTSMLAADIQPIDRRSPVFRVYVPFPSPNQQRLIGGPQVTYDMRRPVLVISTVREVKTSRHGNTVVLTLNDQDRKIFATLTRTYRDGLLLLEGQGSVLSALHITQPLDNGVLEFKNPDDASVIQYLRRRFSLN